ncbi:MAG: cell division protein FtsQ/DivIB [Planctomycetota bacterium]
MAASKSTKKPTVRRRFYRLGGRLLLWGTVFALIGAAGWVGATRAWGAIQSRPEFRLDLQAFSLNGSPPWVNGPALSRELRRELTALPRAASIFERDAARAVYHELTSSPWLTRVQRVQRRLPNRLLVRATFRKPAGMARWEGQRILVDRNGYALPEDLFNAPPEWDEERMPGIVDRLLSEPPPYGAPWDEPRMAVGARLTDYLRRAGLFDRLNVTTVDVTSVGRETTDPDIVLSTAGGVDIKWGASSVYPRVGLRKPPFLKPDEEKLAMLLTKLESYPGLEGIQYVDLRFSKVYFRRQE